ncbi:hypothetical protein ACSBR2_020128 [Camellia fascicularis]
MAYQALSDSMLLIGFLHGIALLGRTQQGPLRNTSFRMLPPRCIKELQGPQEVTLAGTLQSHLHIHDGSDIKSESGDLNSWTRSGGHLMRTTTADKIIEFAQNLDDDSKLSKGMMGHHNNFVIQMVGKDPYYQVLKVATPDRSSDMEFNQRDVNNRVPVNNSSIMVVTA